MSAFIPVSIPFIFFVFLSDRLDSDALLLISCNRNNEAILLYFSPENKAIDFLPSSGIMFLTSDYENERIPFMITLERTSVMNLENAIRGARNPMNSWNRMDSYYDENGQYQLGPNDLGLAMRLRKAGSDHRKFIRQIFVSVDITAPLYWWKEYDTYKVATVANSTSTMHKISSKPFAMEDFSCDHMTADTRAFMETVVAQLESIRLRYLETKKKEDWYDMIQLLPSSYNQMRTCSFNYETLINIYFARKDHKLAEWHTFCDWIKTLPYAKELILAEE